MAALTAFTSATSTDLDSAVADAMAAQVAAKAMRVVADRATLQWFEAGEAHLSAIDSFDAMKRDDMEKYTAAYYAMKPLSKKEHRLWRIQHNADSLAEIFHRNAEIKRALCIIAACTE